MKRYLGNKMDLLAPIMAAVERVAPRGSLVVDAFSGTLSVALELKRRGYRVAANDINAFSSMFGRAFLSNSAVPDVDTDDVMGKRLAKRLMADATIELDAMRGTPGFSFLGDPHHRPRFVRFSALLRYLQGISARDVPAKWRRQDFFDTYTEAGARSAFVSARGTKGRRRFFSETNAHHIDAALSLLRMWLRTGAISEIAHAMLVCALIDAIERVSNTQGTYHDFPRDIYDSRALKPMRLELPALDGLLGSTGHIVGRAEDSLDFMRRVPPHEVLYLDPPYNFRQYTSYYFLPNVVARYAEIEDLDDYFGRVEFVRGQNMDDDFDSPFCKAGLFIDSLRTLIERAATHTVLLSYFDGRNHWSDFKQEENSIGYTKLVELFQSQLFERGSLSVVPIPRKNYQSYGGYKSVEITEFLFMAHKAYNRQSGRVERARRARQSSANSAPKLRDQRQKVGT